MIITIVEAIAKSIFADAFGRISTWIHHWIGAGRTVSVENGVAMVQIRVDCEEILFHSRQTSSTGKVDRQIFGISTSQIADRHGRVIRVEASTEAIVGTEVIVQFRPDQVVFDECQMHVTKADRSSRDDEQRWTRFLEQLSTIGLGTSSGTQRICVE